jgi:hypothetical protein
MVILGEDIEAAGELPKDDWLMTAPRPRATIDGAAARVISQAPCRFTRIIASASGISRSTAASSLPGPPGQHHRAEHLGL